jgi:hypothetical protein
LVGRCHSLSCSPVKSKWIKSSLGPVYNSNERVEGYTNFLWAALLATASHLSLDLVTVAKLLGWLCSLGTLVVTLCLAHELTGLPTLYLPHLVAPLLLASNLSFTAWAGAALEIPMSSLLVLLAGWQYLRELSYECSVLSGSGLLWVDRGFDTGGWLRAGFCCFSSQRTGGDNLSEAPLSVGRKAVGQALGTLSGHIPGVLRMAFLVLPFSKHFLRQSGCWSVPTCVWNSLSCGCVRVLSGRQFGPHHLAGPCFAPSATPTREFGRCSVT